MNNHSIIVENRILLRASGVKSTESFRNEKIILHTLCGDLMITGSGLCVDELNTASGDIEVHGNIDMLKYLSDGRHIPDNIISKLFK